MKKNISFFLYITLLISLLISSISYAQTTKITGIVSDSLSGEPLPFVNVQLLGTKIGATTGFDGSFVISTNAIGDSILISYVGYYPRKIKVKSGSYQDINISLAQANIELSTVVILPSENPAHKILRKVIANKINNSQYNFEAYEYKIYNKVQVDANNITNDFKNRRSMRPFQFVFENIDTSTINGKSYLPLLLSETISEFYYRKNPEAKKETIIASRISGVNNSSVSQFTGAMYQSINIYDNYMSIFDKNFVSPIADFGLRTYRYYLIDSAFIDGNWCYQIMFKPKRIQEATFTGELWITDTTFAVKKVDMKIEKVNLNFVNAILIQQDFTLFDHQYWMLERESFVADFNIVEKTKRITGFYGHKTTLYQDIIINKPRPKEDYRTNVAVEIDDDAWDKPKAYWDTARFEELNLEEEKIYTMVDTITEMPAFQNIYDLIVMLATGYYETPYFEYGPYFTVYSFNSIEGNRFRVGGRTSSEWNDKFRFYGHLAYGTKDEEFKFGLGTTFILNNNPRKALDFSYKKDMEQLGESVRALQQDNIISSIFRSSPNNTLTMVEQYKASFEYEYFNGFSNTLTFNHREVFPLKETQFEIFKNGPDKAPHVYNSIITSEIELKTHFAYHEVFLVDKFSRSSLGTKYPHINIWYAYGIPNLLNSQFEYHKFQISAYQNINIGTIGRSTYILSYGKIWGQLPYPLLEVHPGNETYSYDDFSYSRMNYYEFISDEYFLANFSHNFQGLFFNHIPLLRRLKWREVTYFKVLFGTLTKDNLEYSTFPSNTSRLTKPYYEVGLGIENIFKFVRVDFTWRLNYLDKPDVRPFGIMASMRIDF